MLPFSSLCGVLPGLIFFQASVCLFMPATFINRFPKTQPEGGEHKAKSVTGQATHPCHLWHPQHPHTDSVPFPKGDCEQRGVCALSSIELSRLAGCTFHPPPKAANPANHLASGLSGFVLTTQLHKSVDKTASSVLMTLLPVSQESPLQKQSNVKYLNNTPWCTLISHKYFFNIS